MLNAMLRDQIDIIHSTIPAGTEVYHPVLGFLVLTRDLTVLWDAASATSATLVGLLDFRFLPDFYTFRLGTGELQTGLGFISKGHPWVNESWFVARNSYMIFRDGIHLPGTHGRFVPFVNSNEYKISKYIAPDGTSFRDLTHARFAELNQMVQTISDT